MYLEEYFIFGIFLLGAFLYVMNELRVHFTMPLYYTWLYGLRFHFILVFSSPTSGAKSSLFW